MPILVCLGLSIWSEEAAGRFRECLQSSKKATRRVSSDSWSPDGGRGWVDDSLCVHPRNRSFGKANCLTGVTETPWLSASACRTAASYCLPSQPSLVHLGVLERRDVGRQEWSSYETKIIPCLIELAYCSRQIQTMSSSNSRPPVQRIIGPELESWSDEKVDGPVVPRVDICPLPTLVLNCQIDGVQTAGASGGQQSRHMHRTKRLIWAHSSMQQTLRGLSARSVREQTHGTSGSGRRVHSLVPFRKRCLN
jgi:hypothetical protein